MILKNNFLIHPHKYNIYLYDQMFFVGTSKRLRSLCSNIQESEAYILDCRTLEIRAVFVKVVWSYISRGHQLFIKN